MPADIFKIQIKNKCLQTKYNMFAKISVQVYYIPSVIVTIQIIADQICDISNSVSSSDTNTDIHS